MHDELDPASRTRLNVTLDDSESRPLDRFRKQGLRSGESATPDLDPVQPTYLVRSVVQVLDDRRFIDLATFDTPSIHCRLKWLARAALRFFDAAFRDDFRQLVPDGLLDDDDVSHLATVARRHRFA